MKGLRELESHMIKLLNLPDKTRKIIFTMEKGCMPIVEVEYYAPIPVDGELPIIKETFRLVRINEKEGT